MELSKELLNILHKPLPRYTSYPTAVEFEPLSSDIYAQKLCSLPENTPLSLYFHIPFCKTMCLYCACSVILNRKRENEEKYIDYIMKEIDLVTTILGKKKKVFQLHFGGGTPTKLDSSLLKILFSKITAVFDVDFNKEIAIEIDPRSVLENDGEKLILLKSLGFNRVSFGVQDTDEKVQNAIKRYQSYEMTQKTFEIAKALKFQGINIDLIYGLPFQTRETFKKTISDILTLRPDRIALFSYAKVPWLKPHQKAIKESSLPSFEEKFAIYIYARKTLIEQGYIAIGMDHFALPDDELARAYCNKNLQRNFQGYTCQYAQEMISFGITAIGFVNNAYIQNQKDLVSYYEFLDKKILPIYRGKLLNEEDILRKWVISTLMCDFYLDKKVFSQKFDADFDSHFSDIQDKLKEFESLKFLVNYPSHIKVTNMGELFIRNIASLFDAYRNGSSLLTPTFSQSI